MNSNNNNWKQKALTPVVLKETDDSFSTVSDLMNAIEKDEIMASFTPSSVTMNKSLANRICEYQSKQYSECNESILYDAISLCEDEHNAVLAVGHKIKQAGVDDSVINTLIERLPNAYNDLSKVSKHPKIIDTDYIRVNTKKERRS